MVILGEHKYLITLWCPVRVTIDLPLARPVDQCFRLFFWSWLNLLSPINTVLPRLPCKESRGLRPQRRSDLRQVRSGAKPHWNHPFSFTPICSCFRVLCFHQPTTKPESCLSFSLDFHSLLLLIFKHQILLIVPPNSCYKPTWLQPLFRPPSSSPSRGEGTSPPELWAPEVPWGRISPILTTASKLVSWIISVPLPCILYTTEQTGA